MQPDYKKKTLSQLKKAEGMLKRVVKMIENDVYCIDLLQQSLATVGLMKAANKTILENHLNSCYKAGMLSGSKKKQDALIQELLRIINKA